MAIFGIITALSSVIGIIILILYLLWVWDYIIIFLFMAAAFFIPGIITLIYRHYKDKKGIEKAKIKDENPKIIEKGKLKSKNMKKDFTSFAVCTIGKNPKEDRIAEIAAVKYRNNEETDTFTSYINVPYVSYHAADIYYADRKLIKEAYPASKVMKDFYAFIGDDFLIGENFDITLDEQIDFLYTALYRISKGFIILKNDYGYSRMPNDDIKYFGDDVFEEYVNEGGYKMTSEREKYIDMTGINKKKKYALDRAKIYGRTYILTIRDLRKAIRKRAEARR